MFHEELTKLRKKRKALVEQVKRIRRPRPKIGQIGEIQLYNKMVMGMQNYYRIATHINLNAMKLHSAVMTVITNRLGEISRKGRKLTTSERMRYGKYLQVCKPSVKKLNVLRQLVGNKIL